MAAGRKTGGRIRGTPNKATLVGQQMMRELADDPVALAKYRSLYRRGELHPSLVRTIWAYAWGPPKEPIEHERALERLVIMIQPEPPGHTNGARDDQARPDNQADRKDPEV